MVERAIAAAQTPVLTDADFRILVESVQDYAIFLLDPQGFIRSWNKGAERLKGYKADEIIGKHFSVFYRPEDAKSGFCEHELQVALAEGRFEDSGWRVRKDGSQFWANVIITALRNERGEHIGFAKVTRDLTETAYKTFVQAANGILWSTDPSGRPNADSPTWREFTGQSEAQWRGKGALEAVHPDDAARVEEGWARARAAGRVFECEARVRRKDGTFVWMGIRAVPLKDGDGTLREWFGVTSDISGRKRAEEERERATAIWETTLRSIGDAVISTDASGRITFMNPVAEQLTGWPADKGAGTPLTDVFTIVNEETRRAVANPVDRVLREGVIVGLANHTVLVRRDGVDIPVNDSAAPIKEASGHLHGAVLVFRDVTEEKQELARRASLAKAGEELLRASDYRDALRVVASLAVPRLADWAGVDIVVDTSGDAVITEQLAVAHADPAKVAYAQELNRRYPPDPRAKQGVPQVVRTGKSELYRDLPRDTVLAAARDSEHRRLLEKLQLRSAVVAPLKGREKTFGTITLVYAESNRHYTEEDVVLVEELARRAAVVIERRKLEEERANLLERERAARHKAELANRSKDEFLAVISHEMRNPLSVMLGRVQLLMKKRLSAELKKHLATIERSGRAQARLIEDVLDVSRVISGKLRLNLQPVDAHHLITDAIAAGRPLANAKGVALEVKLGHELELTADPVRVQQIVANLVSNAVKFTPEGGTVEVEAARVGSNLRIVVRDTGEGIRAEFLSEIFEPFRQADASTTRRHGGLGLGLTIVRQLATAHGGTVRAESPGPGQGATFIVELPAALETPAVSAATEPVSDGAPLRGIRVLAVDDSPEALELIGDLLTDAGAKVERASSATEALKKLSKFSADVLVTDIGMPEHDGYELLEKARAMRQGDGALPAIALTAYARPEDAEGSLRRGFEAHLEKPIDAIALVEKVAELGRRDAKGG